MVIRNKKLSIWSCLSTSYENPATTVDLACITNEMIDHKKKIGHDSGEGSHHDAINKDLAILILLIENLA